MPHFLSHSKLYLYRQCPLRYRFAYVDQIRPTFTPAAFAFGTSIHKALAWYYQSIMDAKKAGREKLSAEFEAAWIQVNKGNEVRYGEKEAFESLLQMGKKMLDVFFLKVRPGKIRAVEQSFEVELENPETGEILDVPLRGVIDLIEEKPEGRGTVVCHKTASKEYSELQIAQNLQLSIYALAAQKLGFCKEGNVLLRIDVLLKNENPDLLPYYAMRGRDDLRKLYLIVSQVWRAIREELFYPNYGYHCQDCPYQKYCRDW